MIRSQITGTTLFNDLDSNDLGVNIGGGVHGFFSDNVGLRGDLRYFRSLQDTEPDGEFDLGLSDFDFWRGWRHVPLVVFLPDEVRKRVFPRPHLVLFCS